MNTYLKDTIIRAIKTGAQAGLTVLAGNGASLFTVDNHTALIIVGGSTLASVLMSIQNWPGDSSATSEAQAAYFAGKEVGK